MREDAVHDYYEIPKEEISTSEVSEVPEVSEVSEVSEVPEVSEIKP